MTDLTSEDLVQLEDTLKQGERGIWACVQSNNGYGIACGAVLIADCMTLSNSYLVDTMHAHFGLMLDQLKRQADQINKLKEELALSTLTVEIKTTEVEKMRASYQTSLAAIRSLEVENEKLTNLASGLTSLVSEQHIKLNRLETPENFHCEQ